MPETTNKLRVSLGTAIVLGFIRSRLDAAPTTAYLMTYVPSRCSANCVFCPQARESTADLDRLSRVVWPIYSTTEVIEGLSKAIQGKKIHRVCIQALNFPEFYQTLVPKRKTNFYLESGGRLIQVFQSSRKPTTA